jgi:glycerophosphoryl diester phosphodiesterase
MTNSRTPIAEMNQQNGVATSRSAPAGELLAPAWRDLRGYWRQSFGFHLLIQLLGAAILAPIMSWLAERVVLAAGAPVISNYDIASFVLSPTGLVFVLVVAALTLGLALAALAGQTFIAGHAIARRPVRVSSTVAFVLPRLPRITALGARVFLRLVVLSVPFLATAAVIWYATLRGHDINYFLAENPIEWRRAKMLAALLGTGYALLAAWQLARWLFAVPLLVLEGATPAAALSASARTTKGRTLALVTPLIAWWLAVTVTVIALAWTCRHLSDAGLAWAGIDVRRVLPLVALYVTVTIVVGFLYSAVHIGGHQMLTTRMFARRHDPDDWSLPPPGKERDARSRSVAHGAGLAIVVLLAVALGGPWLAASRLELAADVAVTAHRGASMHAPENSMAAFRAALDAGSTYAELDVQRTRDGRIAVLHDGDLMRVGGDPRKLSELTSEELRTIDIGSKYDGKFAGEVAPLLEDVIGLARGRMKINVELKYNVPDAGLAPAVIDLLRREGFLDQVVITSLDYAALRQVESIEPRLVTGHIVTAAVGDVVRTEADFLSLGSAHATAALIRRAHAAGKEVHVWTVNKPEVMLRMIERGADNVITDDPALFARVLQQRNALSPPEILGLGLRVLFSRAPPELTDPEVVEQL